MSKGPISKNSIIEINGRFAFQRDSYNWHLLEKSAVKDGPQKRNKYAVKRSFHATLGQVCKEAIDRSAGSMGSLQKIIDMLEAAEKGVLETANQSNDSSSSTDLDEWLDRDI